jgi:biofilm PGA synthesis N-glycosyltransferase PgaC
MEVDRTSTRYVVISPVKDEAPYVERTLESMVKQTIPPILWVIVDYGSSDRTPEILLRYEREHSFIKVVRKLSAAGHPREGWDSRQPGSPVVLAFNTGYDLVEGVDYDFVVKLDCDLSFEADYFEKLLAHFALDERLGIASGVYLESPDGRRWIEIEMPSYHAAGASKVVRKTCFQEIGGFVAVRGWDTLDEIRAMARGWQTTHFRDLKMRHWKIEGSGIGQWRTNSMHGEIYYRTGGGLLFFVLKVLHRVTKSPYGTGALALCWGYIRSIARRKPLLVTEEERRHYRALLNSRIYSRLNVLRPSRSI